MGDRLWKTSHYLHRWGSVTWVTCIYTRHVFTLLSSPQDIASHQPKELVARIEEGQWGGKLHLGRFEARVVLTEVCSVVFFFLPWSGWQAFFVACLWRGRFAISCFFLFVPRSFCFFFYFLLKSRCRWWPPRIAWLKGTRWDGMPYHVTLGHPGWRVTSEQVEARDPRRFFTLTATFNYTRLLPKSPATASAQSCGSGARRVLILFLFFCVYMRVCVNACCALRIRGRRHMSSREMACCPCSAGSSESWVSGRGGSGTFPSEQPRLQKFLKNISPPKVAVLLLLLFLLVIVGWMIL